MPRTSAPGALPLLLAALAAAPALAEDRPVPVIHLGVGTGLCPRPTSDVRTSGNPCWVLTQVAAGLRFGPMEIGTVYEGREPIDAIGLFLVRPASATVLGGTVGLVAEPGARWRLGLAGEAGWRRYQNFSGGGFAGGWAGAADTAYAGATGRVGFGLRPETGGMAQRWELSLAWRKDLRSGTDLVDGTAWRAGGWSLTMGVGLLAEW